MSLAANSKSQNTKHKQIPNPNHQMPNQDVLVSDIEVWDFGFVCDLYFVIWDFTPNSVPWHSAAVVASRTLPCACAHSAAACLSTPGRCSPDTPSWSPTCLRRATPGDSRGPRTRSSTVPRG